jgi:autotransporter-associated beta strand protein
MSPTVVSLSTPGNHSRPACLFSAIRTDRIQPPCRRARQGDYGPTRQPNAGPNPNPTPMKLFPFAPRGARSFCALLFLVSLAVHLRAVPAFPGAEGFGANATGGRGGSVYVVTNLNDSGPGSFRDAVSQPNRTVIFAVGGVIKITSRVVVRNNITIAGQTAPGGGITIYGNGISFSNANNTICRYIRFRQGIGGDSGTDAVGIASGDSMIFDHVSASWGRDETFSVSGTPSNITLQDCIVGQGLLAHSAGGLMQTDGGVSVFRTLYTDNWMRNPKVKGVHEFTNNVVYNWGGGGGYILGDSAGQSYANISNNYFIAGPDSPSQPFTRGNLNFHVFADNNFHDANRNGTLDGAIVPPSGYTTVDFVPSRYPYPAVATLLNPEQTYAHIVAHAGASLHRDQVDSFMISELVSLGTAGAQIVSEDDVGGPGIVAGGIAAADADGDGMPDWWESAAGTDPAVADNNGDRNGDGYTNLENYINALAPAGVPDVTITGIDSDTGASANDGITTTSALMLRGSTTPGRVVTVVRADTGIIGTAVADGSGQWSFDYRGTALADRFYAFTAFTQLPSGIASPLTPAFVVRVDTAAPPPPAINGLVTTPVYAFTGTATPGDEVTVSLVGGGTVATATADELGRWTANYVGSPPAAGVYSFTAAAIDLAGNPGGDSAPYVVNTALVPPAFGNISDDTGASPSDRITRDSTLTFAGTAAAGAIVTVTREGTGVIGTATASGSGDWTFSYAGTTLPAGDHTFTATADMGGTSSPVSAPFAVKVDTTAPTIDAIVRHNPASASTAASTLVFRVNFIEPVVNVDSGDFVLTMSGAGMTGSIASISSVSARVYEVTVTGAGGDGTIRLDRRANSTIQDLAGNAGSSGTYTGGQSYTMRLPGSSVWTNSESGGLWSETANWEGGVIANGMGATADFSQGDVDSQTSVVLDSTRTIGRLVFGDADQSATGAWTLTDNGNPANTLNFAAPGTPSIQVNFTGAAGQSNPDIAIAGAAFPTLLDVAVNSSTGLAKSGWGTAILGRIGSFSGPISVTQGRLKLGPGAVLTVPTISLAVSTQFEVAGGDLTVTGDATMVSGTGVGYVVSAGNASFQRIVPTNARNNLVKVTGGTLTATELNFLRSADAANMYGFGLVIQGGESSIATVGLGTGNSWGNMSVEGGRLAVNDLTLGFQQTAGRGGQARVTGGELSVNNLVMSRKNGTNANNVAELHLLGGTTTVGRLVLGYDATVNAGVATLNLNGGTLYVGTGGIVRQGVAPFVTNLNLVAGVLGAKTDWGTAVPLALTGSVTVQAADAAGAAHEIAFDGELTGSGELTKTGEGTLTLAAGNAFTGSLVVNGGRVRIGGPLAAGGTVTINAAGSVVGDGTVSKPIVLNGTLAPGGTSPSAALTGNALTWNGSGQLAISLAENGVSNRVILSGPLTKGTAGSYGISLTAGTGVAAGNTYTLATFASTDFTASDFTVTGLPPGFGAVLSLNGTSLEARIVITPVITSALTASGTYGEPFSYTISAANEAAAFNATGLPPGLEVDIATGLISGTPAATGNFPVTIQATNAAGSATATLALTIQKAAGVVTLANLQQAYDGTARIVAASTNPEGLAVALTYDGATSAPTLPGTYAVVATINDPNYAGAASGTLEVTVTAQVRHAPTLNGYIEGSAQILNPENVTLNGRAVVTGDLLVPGTPTVRLNGRAEIGGILDSSGHAIPSNHSVTLNGEALLRNVVRRVNPTSMPTVGAPPSPAGTRTVSLDQPGQDAGDFGTLRNLTLNSNVGAVAVPAGTYGNFAANSGSGLVLGVAGSGVPAVYHFQNLTLNSGASLQVVGPVVIVLNSGLATAAPMGAAAHPEWLEIRLANGGLSLAGSVTVHAVVAAPNGSVTLDENASLIGRVSADRLVINGNGLLAEPAPQD